MRSRFALLLFAVATPLFLSAQPQPQTARQALLEMFFGKPGSFEKHLPKATLAAIQQASGNGPSVANQFAMFSMLANAPGSHLQTFEAGSTLLTYSDDRTQTKFEVNIDGDDLRGDEDEIQFSFQGSRMGQPVGTPVMPTMSALMKQEAGVWKLNMISVTIRVPLADPAFLKAMTTMSQQKATDLGAITAGPGPEVSAQPKPNEASAIASVRSILGAEMTYANRYPGHGFTCTLSDLDGFGSDSPNEHQAMLIESRLASGKKAGYVFALTGCTGLPSSKFQVVAVPATPGLGIRSFCSDQSGIVRASADGQGASCVLSGKPLQ